MEVLGDFHLHSNRSYDNIHGPTINQIMNQVNQFGLQVAAITDHDQTFDSKHHQYFSNGYDVLPISGIEISCNDGHIVILGSSKPVNTYQSVTDAIDQFSTENCVIIAAHPFDPKYGINDKIYNLDVDAIEINGKRKPEINLKARQVAEDLDLPLIGSSDAHRIQDIARICTSLTLKRLTEDDVINSIKTGNCQPYNLKQAR